MHQKPTICTEFSTLAFDEQAAAFSTPAHLAPLHRIKH